MTGKNNTKTTVLLELRPAFDGYAGIPQETRLLFRGLRLIDSLEVEGMLQTSHRILARGTKADGMFPLSHAKRLNRYSRVIVSTAEKPYRTIFSQAAEYIEKRVETSKLTFLSLFNLSNVRLTYFRSRYFEDFVWRTLFAKTLPASDFDLIRSANHRICSTPWQTMQRVGLNTLSVSFAPTYPKLDTRGADIFIAQTPYPGRVRRGTAFVVRYHDAIPVFMPHTIGDKSLHQATHFYALLDNVRSGAYFACVSEATRSALLSMFPEAEHRTVTIHNMASHHYYLEDSPPKLVPNIIRSRLNQQAPEAIPKFLTLREQEHFYRRFLWQEKPLNYLIVVSTVEPRKNHTRVLAAWERIKAEVDPTLKLVVVGALGWDYDLIMKGFRAWIDRGEAFFLSNVPSPDLRVLYRHAAATVCPSLGEGFDFSGIEAMRSGGVAIASDIPVHREVYDDAAEYFDPYSTGSLLKAIEKVIYNPNAKQVQEKLRVRGEAVSSRYLPEKIIPQWDAFLKRVLAEKKQR